MSNVVISVCFFGSNNLQGLVISMYVRSRGGPTIFESSILVYVDPVEAAKMAKSRPCLSIISQKH